VAHDHRCAHRQAPQEKVATQLPIPGVDDLSARRGDDPATASSGASTASDASSGSRTWTDAKAAKRRKGQDVHGSQEDEGERQAVGTG
jgi:hypothetical protein